MFVRYECPDNVGWLGYFVDFLTGEITAFVGLDRKVLFVHEIK